MNEPEPEHEVPPRRPDIGPIKVWLLNHPFIHFVAVFCYWFTGTSLLSSLWVHWLHSPPWTEGHILFFATFMSIVFYFIYRRQLHRFKR